VIVICLIDLLFHMIQLTNRNNTKIHHEKSNHLSVEIKINENTAAK